MQNFQVSNVNLQQPYLLGSLAKSDEIDLPRKPRKLAFTWLKWHANWSCHLRDMGVESAAYTGWTGFAAWGKELHLDYDLMPFP